MLRSNEAPDSRDIMKELLGIKPQPLAKMAREIYEITGHKIHRNQLMRLRDAKREMSLRTVSTLYAYRSRLQAEARKIQQLQATAAAS